MFVIVRLRIALARHAWIRWIIVLSLATAGGWATHQRVSAIDRERDQWGSTSEVLVAATDLEPGGAVDVELVTLPDAAVPPQSLSSLPTDVRLRQHVVAGEILTQADVTATPGPAGRAEPGTAVVGLVDPLARNTTIGLRVHVVSEGVTLTDQATVVDVVDEVTFVAVPAREAAMVAAAAQSGLASLVFLP